MTPVAHEPALGPGVPVVAVDVGGTDTKAALLDASGVLRHVTRTPTPRDHAPDGAAVVDGVVRAVRALLPARGTERPRAIGLLVPGEVDETHGIGVESENLGWRDVPFRDEVAARTGLPVAFGHDVRGAGLAEFRLGAAAAYRDVLVVVIGTGIAAALFVDGRPYRGHGLAGELGHVRVAAGPTCACGARGCLEAVASAAAVARRYTAASGRPVHGSREVLERALAGDPEAGRTWDETLDALALGLTYPIGLLDPEAVVLGGGLAEAGPALFEPLGQRLDELLTFQHRPVLRHASVGENAGLAGAAVMARELVGHSGGVPGSTVTARPDPRSDMTQNRYRGPVDR